MENTAYKINSKTFFKVFAECFLLFLIGVSPFIILSKGAYLSYGDYNVQIIPFWSHIYDMYHQGLPAWDWQSDLGMSFWGSYTFYGLTSPYTLISLVFPKSFLPYAMTLINALKFSAAGGTAYVYCRQYAEKDGSAHICGILYAFSGVQLFNMGYHFSDVISLFPLLLYSFDRLVNEDKRVMFAVMLAVTGFTNYYFFFGICVFLLIYFAVKVWCREFVITRKKFAVIAFETVIGVLLTAAALLPSFLVLQGNKRAGTSIFETNFLSYEESGTVWKIICSMFFIPDLCNKPGLFSNRQLDLASVSLYIPLFLIVGLLVIIKRDSKKWYSRLCIVCLIFAVVPVLNSAFSAFNSRYYARWFFMPLLIMIMMTGKFLDNFFEADIKKELKAVVCIIAGFLLFSVNTIAASEYRDYLLAAAAISLLSVVFLYLMRYDKPELFKNNMKKTVCIFAVIPFLFASMYKSKERVWEHAVRFIESNYNGFQPIELEDNSFFRTVSAVDGITNVTLNYGYPSVSMFHSLIPGATSDFYASADKYRESNTDEDLTNYAIHSFLSVKYDFFYNKILDGRVEIEPEYIVYQRKGFEQKAVFNRYVIYENQNYIPMGFTYDSYINIDEFEPFPPDEDDYTKSQLEESYRREKLLLKAIWLTDEQIEKYGDILTRLPDEQKEETSDEAYVQDCAARRAGAAYEFSPDKNGFTSKIYLDKDNLVFYSVPYVDGFTAYVDGEETEIEKVFGGLCAVKVPEGDHTIRFDYVTPGLKAGAAISIAALVVLAAYGAAVLIYRRKNKS